MLLNLKTSRQWGRGSGRVVCKQATPPYYSADMFWTVVVFLVSSLAAVNLFGYVRTLYRQWRALKPLPGESTHWFWGNLDDIRPDEDTLVRVQQFLEENRYRVTKGWLGPVRPVLGVYHPEVVKKIMKEPKFAETMNLLKPWLGDGILVSSGDKWFRNRRLLTPAFHYEILKPYVSVYNSSLEVFLDKWMKSAKNGEPVKLFDTISLLSLDIILQCAFSSKSDCQTARPPYIKAVYTLIDLVADRFFTPLYMLDWIYFFLPAGRKMRKMCKIAHDHSEKVIKERKKALGLETSGAKIDRATVLAEAKKQRKYLDFLDILLTATDEEGIGLTDLEIRDEADTFMFEGHDTTTSGMSWTLYLLAKHPEHQEKVREEVRSVLMGREWLEYDDLKDLKYTQWCIKEAMRLYPPVFIIFRETGQDLEIEGTIVPKGVQILISIFHLHRHPDVWENPNEFDPLRFHPSNAEGRDPYAYIPFSAGQRNCIGQNFALNEEKTVVASILNRFKLSLDEDHKVEMVPKVVLRTTNDIKVRLEPL